MQHYAYPEWAADAEHSGDILCVRNSVFGRENSYLSGQSGMSSIKCSAQQRLMPSSAGHRTRESFTLIIGLCREPCCSVNACRDID